MRTIKWLPGLAKRISSGKNKYNFLLKSKSILLISSLFFIVFSFASCDENMWLRSEKKIRGQLSGTWTRLFVTSGYTDNEFWTFKDGTLLLVVTERVSNNKDDFYNDLNDADGSDTISVDIGNYSVDTKIDNAYVRIDNLEKNVNEYAKQGLNSKWTIIEIDGGLLYIAAENGSAIIQREFQKK